METPTENITLNNLYIFIFMFLFLSLFGCDSPEHISQPEVTSEITPIDEPLQTCNIEENNNMVAIKCPDGSETMFLKPILCETINPVIKIVIKHKRKWRKKK